MSIHHPKLNSLGEFWGDFKKVIGLVIKNRKSLSRLDPRFRETVCLAITLANNCRL